MARRSLKSWPPTGHDHLVLPDGRTIGKVPTTELTTMLVEFAAPGVSHENGRAANVEAYAKHLATLRAAGGTPAVEEWFKEGRKRTSPQLLAFETKEDGVYVIGGWPPRVLITASELADPPPFMVVDDIKVTFGVKNGFASYRRGKQSGGGWVFSVAEHEYIP